jgi:hypothetical protein
MKALPPVWIRGRASGLGSQTEPGEPVRKISNRLGEDAKEKYFFDKGIGGTKYF